MGGEDGTQQDIGALVDGHLGGGPCARGCFGIVDDQGCGLVAGFEQGHFGRLGQRLAEGGIGTGQRHQQANRGGGTRNLRAGGKGRHGSHRRGDGGGAWGCGRCRRLLAAR